MILDVSANFISFNVIEKCAELEIAATESDDTKGTSQGECVRTGCEVGKSELYEGVPRRLVRESKPVR